MLNRRAQNLPIWQPVLPRLGNEELNVITTIVSAVLALEVLVMSVGLLGAAWSRVPAVAPVAAAAPAAPVAEPIVQSAPAQPIVAPAPAPSVKTLPVVQVNWQVVTDAPSMHALFVRNGELYGVTKAPTVITWHLREANWVSRIATTEESQLIIHRGWNDYSVMLTEILGSEVQGTWVAVSSETTFALTRGPLGDDLRFLPRFFLKGQNGWVEVTAPPSDGLAYGFVRFGNQIFATIKGQLWQATTKNP